MRPLMHPILVNGRFGDPAVYVETRFERRAVLFDLGDVSALGPRQIGRLEHVFVSHAHIDHFVGFDRLLRVLVGRERIVRLYGPEGFADRVRHKLAGYHWNLVDRYVCDLVFEVLEIGGAGEVRETRFRLKTAFTPEELGPRPVDGTVVLREPAFRVEAAVLEHRTPCLGFALSEARHVNVWKTRLAERGLPVGPWLRDLKAAVLADAPDDTAIGVPHDGGMRTAALGELRAVVTLTAGQKIAYVTDVADTTDNRAAIVALAAGADTLFIEAAFAAADAGLAAERAHLTTTAAGEIARAAGVRRLEPFHFSPRYEGEEARMLAEVETAFRAA